MNQELTQYCSLRRWTSQWRRTIWTQHRQDLWNWHGPIVTHFCTDTAGWQRKRWRQTQHQTVPLPSMCPTSAQNVSTLLTTCRPPPHYTRSLLRKAGKTRKRTKTIENLNVWKTQEHKWFRARGRVGGIWHAIINARIIKTSEWRSPAVGESWAGYLREFCVSGVGPSGHVISFAENLESWHGIAQSSAMSRHNEHLIQWKLCNYV